MWVALAGWLALTAACATGRGLGVHPDYRKQAIESVAIWPFYTGESFRVEDADRRHLLDTAEQRATVWLSERIPKVSSPSTLADRLGGNSSGTETAGTGAAAAHGQQSGGALDDLNVDLRSHFNPAERHRPSKAARRLMTWHEHQKLPERYVLLGHIIYHTVTTCRVRASDFYDRAQVQFHENIEPSLPNPCVVTHLRFKLVDASRGATVWYNEGLREYHVPEVTPEYITHNTDRLVTRLLGGPDGLDDLFQR